ncbi:hypothetical protein VNO80_06926 [Phaseolus coccineus]|uniref:Uncharacterized protein n=1 Tax=Phaseolus coccineus TaxID=3886 RepID=A0AAN9NHR3_PHACN
MAARERERGRARCYRRGARWRVTPEAGERKKAESFGMEREKGEIEGMQKVIVGRCKVENEMGWECMDRIRGCERERVR